VIIGHENIQLKEAQANRKPRSKKVIPHQCIDGESWPLIVAAARQAQLDKAAEVDAVSKRKEEKERKKLEIEQAKREATLNRLANQKAAKEAAEKAAEGVIVRKREAATKKANKEAEAIATKATKAEEAIAKKANKETEAATKKKKNNTKDEQATHSRNKLIAIEEDEQSIQLPFPEVNNEAEITAENQLAMELEAVTIGISYRPKRTARTPARYI
jgi:hypothetical protein